jgi:hypothetical protein
MERFSSMTTMMCLICGSMAMRNLSWGAVPARFGGQAEVYGQPVVPAIKKF